MVLINIWRYEGDFLTRLFNTVLDDEEWRKSVLVLKNQGAELQQPQGDGADEPHREKELLK